MREKKVAYPNIYGLISSKLELEDKLRREKPDIMCLLITKLRKEIHVLEMEKGRHQVWRSDREGMRDSGVMVMLRTDIKLDEVIEGRRY